MNLLHLSLFSSLLGLLLVYYSIPAGYPPASVETALSNCDGRLEIHGTLVKQFVSRKGSLIGIIEGDDQTIMAVLDSHHDQTKIRLRATLSDYNGQCWAFEE